MCIAVYGVVNKVGARARLNVAHPASYMCLPAASFGQFGSGMGDNSGTGVQEGVGAVVYYARDVAFARPRTTHAWGWLRDAVD